MHPKPRPRPLSAQDAAFCYPGCVGKDDDGEATDPAAPLPPTLHIDGRSHGVTLAAATDRSVEVSGGPMLELGATVTLRVGNLALSATVAGFSPEATILAFDKNPKVRSLVDVLGAHHPPHAHQFYGSLYAKPRTETDVSRGPRTNLPTASLKPNADGTQDVIFEPVDRRKSSIKRDGVLPFKRKPKA